MTPTDVMSQCQESGITLGVDGKGGLTYRGKRDAVNRLLPAIRQHKPELLRLLTIREAHDRPVGARPAIAKVHFTLRELYGRPPRPGSGNLIDLSGYQAAVHCLKRTYGNRLATIDGRPAEDVIKEVLGDS